MFTRKHNKVPLVDGEPTNVQKLPFVLSYVSPIFPNGEPIRRKFGNKAIGFESKEARDMCQRRYALDHPTELQNYNDSYFLFY